MHRILLRACSNMPFYAVRTGKIPGIYNTWADCERQVKGHPKARYKKFGNVEEAQEFINEESASDIFIKKNIDALAVKKTTVFKSKGNNDIVSNRKTKLVSEDDFLTHTFSSHDDLPTSAVVYTDGSCLGNGTKRAIGGIGVYWAPCHPRNISEYLDVENPTNQKAELRAASRALESAIEMNLTSVELRTDSVYTIKAMTEWIKTWQANGWRTSANKDVMNKDEMLRLSNLCTRISVKWVHVAAHKGIYGNEQADQLANEGALGRGR